MRKGEKMGKRTSEENVCSVQSHVEHSPEAITTLEINSRATQTTKTSNEAMTEPDTPMSWSWDDLRNAQREDSVIGPIITCKEEKQEQPTWSSVSLKSSRTKTLHVVHVVEIDVTRWYLETPV